MGIDPKCPLFYTTAGDRVYVDITTCLWEFSVSFMFQEVIACNVLLPTVEMVCDPDYINQTIVMWVSC